MRGLLEMCFGDLAKSVLCSCSVDETMKDGLNKIENRKDGAKGER